MNKICEQCGKSFEYHETRGRERRYCSVKCGLDYNVSVRKERARARRQIVCVICEKHFTVTTKGGTKYCSNECRQQRKKLRGKYDQQKGTCDHCGGACHANAKYCGDCYNNPELRLRRELPDKVCVVCNQVFRPTYRAQKCCGVDCANKKANKTKKGQRDTSIVRVCVICGQEFNPYKGKHHTQETCSPYCKRRRDSIKKDKSGYKRNINRRRALAVSATESESFDKTEIFERDGWICQVCGKKVDRNLSYPNPKSASLDHILPMALGGGHTRANVQLAHLRCNIKKSDSGNVQLRLIGTA